MTFEEGYPINGVVRRNPEYRIATKLSALQNNPYKTHVYVHEQFTNDSIHVCGRDDQIMLVFFLALNQLGTNDLVTIIVDIRSPNQS
jgi:hypothetical protein